VERVALNVLNKRELEATDFFMSDNLGCRLQDAARRRYLAALTTQFETPFRGNPSGKFEKLSVHLQWQVQHLCLWIRGQVAELNIWQMS
jgi:hypothetical protein